MLVIIAGIAQFILCQQVASLSYPDYFSTAYLNQPLLINPAYIQDSAVFSSGLAYKGRSGEFKNVASIAANAGIFINNKASNTQASRIIILNEKEGAYISNPKVYGNYGIKLHINTYSSISTGASFGYHGINYTAPSASGTFNSLDGNLGIILKVKNSELGASAEQLLGNKQQLFSNYIYMKRYYQFYLTTQKFLSPSWGLKGHLFWIPRKNYEVFNLSGALEYRTVFGMGTSVRFGSGMSFFVNFKISLPTNTLRLSLNYNTNTYSHTSRLVNNYEAILSYELKKRN